ncbi:MAG TPA: hypothetical protein VIY86_05115 [Pirellulaceae bacterium]
MRRPVLARLPGYLVREAVAHYHIERPHQGLDNDLIVPARRRQDKSAVDARAA